MTAQHAKKNQRVKEIQCGGALVRNSLASGESGMVHRDGEPFYKISGYQAMPPFFVAVVSGSDHWMFLSSNGGLTCGRRNPDSALFPYYTDDKIHDGSGSTGSKTILRADMEGTTYLWQPFDLGITTYRLERNLYKNLAGNKLVYEEINHDIGLGFSYCWSNSERFGFIKKSSLWNFGSVDCVVEILDGILNVLPCGVTHQTQNHLSTLIDAYKQAERVSGLTAGLFTLSSILTDRAEPSEALRATVVWSIGLDSAKVLLSADQLQAFSRGEAIASEDDVRGKRGAFLIQSDTALEPGSEESWYIVADINQGPAQLPALLKEVKESITAATIEADIEKGTRRLEQLVGGSDGCQLSADELVTARHFSNTLFNIMRGGTFYDGYNFPLDDFLEFAGAWNRPLRDQFENLLRGRDRPHTLSSVLDAVAQCGNPDMERLALEYLPLTFSRRHGDPSRPWNQFSIDIKNADGSDKLYYQGNWRDIFQNWEALSLSYPEYIESFIAKFINASTADGYNPYRITRNGIDWEVLEPHNSWSNIGYWGDHQIIYLLKLLELSQQFHPGKIGKLFEREIFVFADVPYRIKDFADLLRDPRDTVIYDYDQEAVITSRVDALGSDGKLMALTGGSICRVSLLEKLLVPLLSKLGNFVPGGGIWMNTQRPEWNDANNALVGYGLSMVTLCYLRRYVLWLNRLLTDQPSAQYALSAEVAQFYSAIDQVLQNHRSITSSEISPIQRKLVVNTLGSASEDYRKLAYAGFSGEKAEVDKSDLLQFLELTLEYIDHSIAANQRPDGLFHSYNLIHFDDDGFKIEHLFEMLEGQVAVLSSGYLDPAASLALLESLRSSAIYRPDQNSYMLYPDKDQKPFLERNLIPEDLLRDNPCIMEELDSGRRELVERDVNGQLHFNGNFKNVMDLEAALGRRPDISKKDAGKLCDVYESVFEHRRFTGRSGSMFKYEGLGSIYWHMVSKLLLATAEVLAEIPKGESDNTVINRLFECFDEIKDGIGIHKTPAEYGAFPIDPYSHTPGFIGVQQPGMTGQVKEDVITRFIELGVRIDEGQIGFEPGMLRLDEFATESLEWTYSTGGQRQTAKLDPGSLAYTICGVPVVYRLAEEFSIRIAGDDGTDMTIDGNRLDHELSRSILLREGRVQNIQVDIPRAELRQPH